VEDKEVNGTHKVRGVFFSAKEAEKFMVDGLHIEEIEDCSDSELELEKFERSSNRSLHID
jgi:hypothetical protein